MPPVVMESLPDYEPFDAVLCAAGVAGLLWAYIPIIATSLRLYWVRFTALEDPSLAEPDGADAEYAEQHTALTRLGFRSAGVIREWTYLFQHDWVRSRRVRHLVSADGKTFAAVYRLRGVGMLRVTLNTMISDGRLVRTAMPGVGLEERLPDYHRTEVPRVPAAVLYQSHLKAVADFISTHGGVVVAVTLAELAAADERVDTRTLGRIGNGDVAWFPVWGWWVPFLIVMAGLYVCSDVSLVRRAGVAAVLATCAYWVFAGPVLRALLSCAERIEPGENQAPEGD